MDSFPLRAHGWCALLTLALGCSAAAGESEAQPAGPGASGSSALAQPAAGPSDAERLAKFTNLGGEELALTGATEATCAAGNFIYLVTKQNLLLQFDPTTLGVTEMGPVACTTASVNSMAVDRNGIAWVGHHEGEIWKIPTQGGACESAGALATQLGWTWFGMAFVSDGGEAETLYLVEAGVGAALGRIESTTPTLNKVGPLNGELTSAQCELTGLGDGRIFALCPGERSYLAELDKATARTLSVTQLPFIGASAFAFAHWGGAFYIFTSVSAREARVDRFTPGLGTERLKLIPYEVLGAGVSTCAPTRTVVK